MNPEEYKEIGEVYRDRFKDHESNLHEDSWSMISAKLPSNTTSYDSFKNGIKDFKFITGVITGIMLSIGIFLLLNQTEYQGNAEGKNTATISSDNYTINSELNKINTGDKESYAVLADQQEFSKSIHKKHDSNNPLQVNLKEKRYIKDFKETDLSKEDIHSFGIVGITNHSQIDKKSLPEKENNNFMGAKTQNAENRLDRLSRHNSSIATNNTPAYTSYDLKLISDPSSTTGKSQIFKKYNSDNNEKQELSSPTTGSQDSSYNMNALILSAKKNTRMDSSKIPESIQDNLVLLSTGTNAMDSIKIKEPGLIADIKLNNKTSDFSKNNNSSIENQAFISKSDQIFKRSKEDKKNNSVNNNSTVADSNLSTIAIPKNKERKHEYKSNSKLNENPQTKFIFGYYFSPESSFRKLSTSSNFQRKVSERNNNEKAKIGFSTGFTCSYMLSGRIVLTSGLYLMNLGEKGAYLSDSSSSSVEKYTNNYTCIGIPILAGFKIGKNKLGTVINSGFILNALVDCQSTNDGDTYYNDDDTGRANKNNDPDDDKNKRPDYRTFAMVYTGNIEFNYQLYKKLSIHVGPSFKYFLSSIYERDDYMKSKPYSMGFQAAIKFHL